MKTVCPALITALVTVASLPAHIHRTLVTKCCGRQAAELMFQDDPLVTKVTFNRKATS
jgi:hypothetical protein